MPVHTGPVSKAPQPPTQPARPKNLQTIDPNLMAARSTVKDPLQNRIVLIHSLCHIESWAIDLSWDILVRFVTTLSPLEKTANCDLPLPHNFYADWLRIAHEEARHWKMWHDRLLELGSFYGALAVHDGLWQSAGDTSHCILSRLAVVHMTHEARGLDVSPKRLAQLASAKDSKSEKLMRIIEKDEITHVTSGITWFRHMCARDPLDLKDPISTFHILVKANFAGSLKPPFAIQARAQAGFTEEWYLPLMSKSEQEGYEGQKRREAKQLEQHKAREENKLRKQQEARIKGQAKARAKAEAQAKAEADAEAVAEAVEVAVAETSGVTVAVDVLNITT
jgi:uncharacterized ferritin-like protein (DUF455 family)